MNEIWKIIGGIFIGIFIGILDYLFLRRRRMPSFVITPTYEMQGFIVSPKLFHLLTSDPSLIIYADDTMITACAKKNFTTQKKRKWHKQKGWKRNQSRL